MAARARRSSRAKGSETNTYAHKRERRQWLARLAAAGSLPCTRCGQPVLPGMLIDLDHDDSRLFYLGLAHRSCNRRAGQLLSVRSPARRRPRLTGRQLAAIRAKAGQQAGPAATAATRRQPPRWLLCVNPLFCAQTHTSRLPAWTAAGRSPAT
jgi:hypothetical protein